VAALLLENTTFERHYRISDLARLWGLGRETVRKLVKDDPGVIKIRMGRKKAHTVYSVPESAARRIHTRLLNASQVPLPESLPASALAYRLMHPCERIRYRIKFAVFGALLPPRLRHLDDVRLRLLAEGSLQHRRQALLTLRNPSSIVLSDHLFRVA
jgi:hypothetical protein